MTLNFHLVLDLSVGISVVLSKLICLPQVIFSSLLPELNSFTLWLIFFIQPSFNPILLALEEVGSGIAKEQGDTVPEESFCRCHQTISIDSCFSLSPVPPLIILQSLSHYFLKHSSDSCTPLLNNHKCIPSIGKKPTKTKKNQTQKIHKKTNNNNQPSKQTKKHQQKSSEVFRWIFKAFLSVSQPIFSTYSFFILQSLPLLPFASALASCLGCPSPSPPHIHLPVI